MTRLTDELKARLADGSPYRMAYYEALLNRIASEVGGNAKFHGERVAAIMDEIDGLRKEVSSVVESLSIVAERVERMAEFLNKQKNGMKT